MSVAFAQRPAGSGEVVENTNPTGAPFTQNTIVLEGADRRPQTSLDGDWHTIVDPYFAGLYSFHHEEKKDGWFRNEHWKGIGAPYRQLPGVQDYFNRKGLISEKGEKKLAFGVLQQAYRSGYGKAE